MKAVPRREIIVKSVRQNGWVTIPELCRQLNVSEFTVRNDLSTLEKSGLLVRVHGGASLKSVKGPGDALLTVRSTNFTQKSIIASKCMELVFPGDRIILDAGSTTTEIALKIKTIPDLTIITTALNIAVIFGTQPTIKVIVASGEFKKYNLSVGGLKAIEFFSGIGVDKLFLSANAVSPQHGPMYSDIEDVKLKQAMMNAANTVYLAADSSKIGKTSLASLDDFTKIDYLVSDYVDEYELRKDFIKDLKVI